MASEFAQEFSKVLKGMEKERIAREKKAEDALIIRETKREADLSKAEIKQQEQAEKDSARQKEIDNTLKKFLTKDGKFIYRNNRCVFTNGHVPHTKVQHDVAEVKVEEFESEDALTMM